MRSAVEHPRSPAERVLEGLGDAWPVIGRGRRIGHYCNGLTPRRSDDKAIFVARPVNDISQVRAAWQAQIVPDPTLPDRSVALCEALRRLRRLLLRGPRRLARAERSAVLAATKASLAGPRDFTGAGYNERLDRCMARANVDVAVCELVALLGARCAELVPELAAILAGTRVASCTPACCNAGSVAQAQRNAREAAVRALNAVGPTGLARLPAGALLPCFAVGERRLTRVAAELLARHVATTPSLVDVLLAACAVRMTDDDPWVSVGLCQALARAGSGLAARDLSDARRFVALRARHEHAAVRAAAVRALGALGARSELAAALRDPAAAVRYAGLRALGQSTRELCRRDARRP